MLSDQDKKRIKDAVDAEVADFIRALPQQVNEMLRKGVASVVGLSDRWGKVEIDHCNGNKGFIGELIKKNVCDECKEQIDAIVRSFIPKLREDDDILDGMYEEARRIYQRELDDELNKQVRKKARQDAAAILAGDPLGDVVLGPENTELEDPNGFEGPLGEVILREKAERL
jgi:hypothetical protein